MSEDNKHKEHSKKKLTKLKQALLEDIFVESNSNIITINDSNSDNSVDIENKQPINKINSNATNSNATNSNTINSNATNNNATNSNATNSNTTNSNATNSNDIESQFSELLETLGNLRGQITQIQNQVRGLEKGVKKQSKLHKKEGKSKIVKKPSGFAKPSKISDELISFMNKTKGTELARTEVTQYIINYIKDNNLQNRENRKNIKPDKRLSELLDCGNDELTYFNIQKYMNKHFIKVV